jgi:hypothetical protein
MYRNLDPAATVPVQIEPLSWARMLVVGRETPNQGNPALVSIPTVHIPEPKQFAKTRACRNPLGFGLASHHIPPK